MVKQRREGQVGGIVSKFSAVKLFWNPVYFWKLTQKLTVDGIS